MNSSNQPIPTLPVVEEFYSIQGEGYNTGKPAYFLRVGGCDVGCGWCDEKRAWDASNFPQLPVDELAERIIACPAKAVVVTGGEPMESNLEPLTTLIRKAGIETFLETSGTKKLSGDWDWICISPKTFKAPLEGNIKLADEIKCIIAGEKDFLWAEECAKLAHKNCLLWLQPEWRSVKEMMPRTIEYILKNPKWRISIQSHKYMHIP